MVALLKLAAMERPPDDPGRRGAVAIVMRDRRMLVIRRSQTVVAPGALCFPGGGIEPNESEQDAIVREFREEVGVTVRPIRRIWQCVTPWKVQLAWWSAEMPPDAVPVPNPAEVAAVEWVTVEQMAQSPDLLESNREFLDLVLQGRIPLDDRRPDDHRPDDHRP